MTVDATTAGDSSPYDVNQSYFLHTQQVRDSIAHLSRSEDLVIFCGAGVSIDRTGMDWGALCRKLLVKECGWTQSDVDSLPATTEPVQLASIAMEELTKKKTDYDAALASLQAWLAVELYPRDEQVGTGNSTRRLFELAAVRAQEGKRTVLITTNYDTSLENAFSNTRKSRLAPGTPASKVPEPQVITLKACSEFDKVCKCNQVRTALTKSKSLVSIVYLHGRIAPSGPPKGKLVFTEYDYLKTRSCVERNLAATILRRDVLIVGSSLRDAPLIQALMSTRRCHERGPFKRYAVLPMAAHVPAGRSLTKADAKGILRGFPRRVAPFDAELLSPDFFAQAWQYVEEVRFCTGELGAYDDPKAPSPYSKRLKDWWTKWDKARLKVPLPTSMGHYQKVLQTTADISAVLQPLDGDPAEAFKVEIWFRNQKKAAQGGRTLQLWVSSSGVLADKSNPRRARLSVASDYAAVRSYQYGRPTLVQATAVPLDTAGSLRPSDARWATFFSVPIETYLNFGYVPVGVVTLASNMAGPDSRLVAMQDNGGIQRAVEAAMNALGEDLLGHP